MDKTLEFLTRILGIACELARAEQARRDAEAMPDPECTWRHEDLV
jgi:hypothetical protein